MFSNQVYKNLALAATTPLPQPPPTKIKKTQNKSTFRLVDSEIRNSEISIQHHKLGRKRLTLRQCCSGKEIEIEPVSEIHHETTFDAEKGTHRHLIYLGSVVLFQIPQNFDILVSDKVDSNSLAPESAQIVQEHISSSSP